MRVYLATVDVAACQFFPYIYHRNVKLFEEAALWSCAVCFQIIHELLDVFVRDVFRRVA